MYTENLGCFYRQEPVKSARDVPSLATSHSKEFPIYFDQLPLTVSTFAKRCLKPWQVVL